MRRASLIALGGAVGALSRYAVGLAVSGVALGILVVNLTGAFALGLLAGALARRPLPQHILAPLLGVGFLGAFTTFSSFVALLAQMSFAAGLAYGAAMVVGGLAAAETGRRLGRRR